MLTFALVGLHGGITHHGLETLAIIRLHGAIAHHGIAGTARLLPGVIRDWKTLRLERAADKAFDREHAVDTAGIIPLQALDVRGRSVALGNRYEATTPELFHRIFATLRIDFKQFTFIDVGAGKGRALLLASEYPFRRIVGVEFSRELVAVAEDNVACWLQKERACSDIALVCGDATEFDLPPGPLVLYFYNPFQAPVMRAMLEKIHQSLRDKPRPLILALRGDETLVAEVLARDFVEVEVGRWPKVFSAGPPAPVLEPTTR